MRSLLGESYSRYRLAAGDFRLKTIVVRDLSGDIFAHSSGDGLNLYTGCHTALVSIARPPLPLLKPSHSLCSFDDQLYAELLVPVGKLEPEAYLHIVAYAVGVTWSSFLIHPS